MAPEQLRAEALAEYNDDAGGLGRPVTAAAPSREL